MRSGPEHRVNLRWVWGSICSPRRTREHTDPYSVQVNLRGLAQPSRSVLVHGVTILTSTPGEPYGSMGRNGGPTRIWSSSETACAQNGRGASISGGAVVAIGPPPPSGLGRSSTRAQVKSPKWNC